MHFPLTEKYIALYPTTPIENKEIMDKRERIRRQLEEEMLHGKKKITGSNKVQLGKRKKAIVDEKETDESEVESEEDSVEDEEDEYLQF